MKDKKPIVADDPDTWPGNFAEITFLIIAELSECQITEIDVRKIGCKIAILLCRELGGAHYYWPHGIAFERATRNLFRSKALDLDTLPKALAEPEPPG